MGKSKAPIALVVACTLILALAQASMKHGLNRAGTLVAAALDPFIIVGIALFVAAGVLMTLALKNGELSVLHPLLSLGFVWALLAGVGLGEPITAKNIAGVGIVVVGVSTIGRSMR